ncbi:MAG: S8 family serine peptidase [Acidobacteria bacterium]|nr:S8 family serine peptidase [Acidobacteriota bacterium]
MSLAALARVFSCLSILAVAGAFAGAAEPPSKLVGDLPAVLDAAAPGELVPVYFVLADQLDGQRLLARAASAIGRDERRHLVVSALKDHAQRTQRGLAERLQAAAGGGLAARIRPLWIGNVIGADATPALVRELAALPEVARVNWNPKRDVFLGQRATPAPLPRRGFGPLAPDAIECGVDLMNAPRVWNELGNTGEGAVIAVIDTGACWTHSDLINQVWVNPGEDLGHDGIVMDPADQNGVDDDGNGFVDDLIGWNFDNNNNQPMDEDSHGSHTAGTVAGDGTAGQQSGMAPDAKVMIVRVGVSFADELDVWNAMQYAAANGAHAISMSLGWPHNQNPDRPTWRTNCENTIDAGTAMVIAAGNEGQGAEPDNIRTPGDVPRVITVAAVDCNDAIAGFSSRGPVSWQDVPPWFDHPYPPGLVKPDVAGPGVNTQSHYICNGYTSMSGTSMATPHVAGAVALMVAANPGLTHDDIKQLLEDTAVDLGATGKDNEYGSGRVDAYEAVLLSASPNGRMVIKEAVFGCAGLLHLTVADSDLRGAGTVSVTVTSATEPGGETVILTETSSTSGAFKGQLATGPGAPAADGVLQVVNGDTAVATYIDANDGQGGINVPKTDSAIADCVAPVIGNVRAEQVGLTSARIRWTTNEPSDSVVDFGALIPPDQQTSVPAMVTSHDVLLSGLPSCTVFYYKVSSTDPYGYGTTDDNAGVYYHFETQGDFGSGPQSCHGGQALLDSTIYSCGTTVTVEVSDIDLNLDPAAADSATLLVTSTTEAEPELVTATETGPNSSRFRGTIMTAPGAPAPDGLLQTREGDLLTVTYLDEDDGTGAPATSFDTAHLDCAGPVITNLRVDTITDQRATFRFTTNEPADTVLEWGTTPALGQVVANATLATEHAVMLSRFDTCQRIYFRVKSTDRWGYTKVGEAGGGPHAFNLGQIPGLYWRDTFENSSGWTLGGEWQIDAPQGRGGSSGLADPVAAYNNAKVLGHDLTGVGSFPGDYEPNRTEKARSPSQDATAWHNTKLILYRRLNSGNNDEASLWLWTNNGVPVYRSDGQPVSEAQFSYQSWDVSQRVDGQPAVSIEFQQRSDGGGNFSGWNVDDVIFKDGTKPDYGPCGGCGAAPSFAGAASAIDNDACGAAGVTVSWAGAAAWGTGAGGSYTIWRDVVPNFTPTNANRIAIGVAALSYNDASAPNNVPLYYLVRAENDETCGGGPHNGGVVDGNTVYAATTDTLTQPTPAEVGGVGAGLVARSHLRLSWEAAAAATSYSVYRSTSPAPGSFTSVAQTPDLFWDDEGQGTNAQTYFYLVRGANTCGNEGP